jgi:hypothetical protein
MATNQVKLSKTTSFEIDGWQKLATSSGVLAERVII